MENDPLEYSPHAAVRDASAARVDAIARMTQPMPWWGHGLLAGIWPVLAVSGTVDGWTSWAIPLLVLAAGAVVAVAMASRIDRSGVRIRSTTLFEGPKWPFVALTVIVLADLAMMPLTDIYGWPQWCILAAGLLTGVLVLTLSLWVTGREATKLALLSAQDQPTP